MIAVLNTGGVLMMHFLHKLISGYPPSDLSKSVLTLPSILGPSMAVKSRSGQSLGLFGN